MKMNKLIFPLVIALAATLASTGCRKGNPKVTVIPGHAITNPNDQNDINTKPFNPADANANANPNITQNPVDLNKPISTSENWKVEDTIQDRAALAAYTVHFKFDSSVVQDKEQANIANVAQALTSDPNVKLLIEGHCDERGTEEYNRSLGERRALALREALARNNIDPMRIRTISYGKDKPADVGHDEAAWSKNRRGEFVLCHPK